MLVEVRKPFLAPHKMVQVGERFHAEDLIANDWIRNGLVINSKSAKTPLNKMAYAPQNKSALDAGKAPAVGEDQPSSVSQAAQASQQQIAESSIAGAKRTTLRLRKPRAKQSR